MSQRPRHKVSFKPPLPTRDGVGPSCVALPEGDWPSVFAFLLQRFPAVEVDEWRRRIARGEVVDEHGVVITEQGPYRPHRRVFYYRSIANEPAPPFYAELLFHDQQLVVVDKPHFMPVTPGGRWLQQSLLVHLKRRLNIDTLVPLHRLDRETAGVVVFGVQPGMRNRYEALFRERRVDKVYEAIAPWRPELALPLVRSSRIVQDLHFLRMQEVPGEPNAQTHVEVIEVRGNLARYRLRPHTGRTHQLRVHCAALGMPIVNDLMYPSLCPEGSDDPERPLGLLARSIAFTDPASGARREFASRRALSWPR